MERVKGHRRDGSVSKLSKPVDLSSDPSPSSTHVKSHATCNRSAGVQRQEDAWALLAS